MVNNNASNIALSNGLILFKYSKLNINTSYLLFIMSKIFLFQLEISFNS